MAKLKLSKGQEIQFTLSYGRKVHTGEVYWIQNKDSLLVWPHDIRLKLWEGKVEKANFPMWVHTINIIK